MPQANTLILSALGKANYGGVLSSKQLRVLD